MRKHEYRDPCLVAITHEYQQVGCGACKHNQNKGKKKTCNLDVVDYPNHTKRSCPYWHER